MLLWRRRSRVNRVRWAVGRDGLGYLELEWTWLL